jgi:hypothetical protein
MSAGRRDPDLFSLDAGTEFEERIRYAENFLRDCALRLAEDDKSEIVQVEHLRQAAALLFLEAHLPQKVPARSRIYVSHSHEDKAFVDELTKCLAAAKLSYRKADKDIQLAEDWATSNWKLISDCGIFLCVVTPRYLKESHWFYTELGAASACKNEIVLALRHVNPSEIPAPFNRHQSMPVENTRQLRKLIKSLKGMCDGSGKDRPK